MCQIFERFSPQLSLPEADNATEDMRNVMKFTISGGESPQLVGLNNLDATSQAALKKLIEEAGTRLCKDIIQARHAMLWPQSGQPTGANESASTQGELFSDSESGS